MKTCYIVKLNKFCIGIADLTNYYSKGLVITRINIPVAFRRQGYGTKLLDQICKDADISKTVLFLEIVSSGDMPYNNLILWYKSKGFKDWHGILRRVYQDTKTKNKS